MDSAEKQGSVRFCTVSIVIGGRKAFQLNRVSDVNPELTAEPNLAIAHDAPEPVTNRDTSTTRCDFLPPVAYEIAQLTHSQPFRVTVNTTSPSLLTVKPKEYSPAL